MEKMHLNETNNEPHITHMDDEYHYNRYYELLNNKQYENTSKQKSTED